MGFDLNPLAVIAARTNYLLALGTLARYLSGKDIPVYLCDSVLTPQTQRTQKRPLEHQKDIPVPSTQKEFWIPEELVDRGQVDALCRLLEHCLDGNYRMEGVPGPGAAGTRLGRPAHRKLVGGALREDAAP